jgi:hypothetical protein
MMDDGEPRPFEANAFETPAEFLTALGRVLREAQQVDSDLAEILSIYLLIETPTNDAVAKAKNAIVKLAEKRAVCVTGAGND